MHLLGVFAFLVSHGVSVGVLFRLRTERDPERINGLLQLSGSSIQAFYASLGLLLLGGIVAGFLGHWWSQGWIWAAIVVLIVTSLAMYGMARPYYRRVGLVSRALAGGTKAVTAEQFDEILRGRRPVTVAVTGLVGLVAILYFMVFKPTLGFGGLPTAAPAPSASTSTSGGGVALTARSIAFSSATLRAPAGASFTLTFDNEDRGVPHNASIYITSAARTALFHGAIVTGPKTVVYHVPALQPGSYFFRCDVHPQAMTGTLTVSAALSPGAGSPSP